MRKVKFDIVLAHLLLFAAMMFVASIIGIKFR